MKIDGQNVVLKVKKADGTFAEVSIPRDGSEMRLPVPTPVVAEASNPTVGTSIVNHDGDLKWLPPLRPSLTYTYGRGSEANRAFHNQSNSVSSEVHEFALELTTDWSRHMASWISWLASGGVAIGYRQTQFRHPMAEKGVVGTSGFIPFSGVLRLGVNIKDWVSLYGLARGRVNPLGGDLGGGLEITGLSWVRIGFDAAYGVANNEANTGVSANLADKANFKGWVLTSRIGFQF